MKKCDKCSSELSDDVKFCEKCGVEVIDSRNLFEKGGVVNKAIPEKKNKNTSNWLLWWNIDEDELKNQVDNYSTLGITKSAKGRSVLFLLLSIIVTVLLLIFGVLDISAYFDVTLFIFLAIFIYYGQRWAMAGAMILWTFEKIFTVYQANGGGGTIVVSVVWWALYMHAFWLAYKVETERKKVTS